MRGRFMGVLARCVFDVEAQFRLSRRARSLHVASTVVPGGGEEIMIAKMVSLPSGKSNCQIERTFDHRAPTVETSVTSPSVDHPENGLRATSDTTNCAGAGVVADNTASRSARRAWSPAANACVSQTIAGLAVLTEATCSDLTSLGVSASPRRLKKALSASRVTASDPQNVPGSHPSVTPRLRIHATFAQNGSPATTSPNSPQCARTTVCGVNA